MRPVAVLHRLAEPLLAPGRSMRASEQAELPLRRADVVFIGDSITAWGHWDEWFPQLVTANRGIDGDRVAGVLARLESIPPASVVALLIGTNDVSRDNPDDHIESGVRAIVRALRRRDPAPRVILQSILPRARAYTGRLRALNRRLCRVASEEGVDWLDLWPILAAPDGSLRPELTLDRLHLTGAGYRAWVDTLISRGFVPDPLHHPHSTRSTP